MRPPFNLAKLRARLSASGMEVGFIDDARRAATPFLVPCNGLNEDNLGQVRFSQELNDRRAWIEAHCGCDHVAEPIRDAQQRLTGRLFRFADPNEAFWFKFRFG